MNEPTVKSPEAVVTPSPPSGVLELLPADQVRHDRMLDQIRASFELFGFRPLSTPSMERAEILLTKPGTELERQIYYLQSTGSEASGASPKTALRFDLTVPLARYVAQHEQQLWFPFRRYQIASVFRGERAQAGRYREFIQCDIDIVDREQLDLAYDAEIPAVIYQVFSQLGLGSFQIRVSNRKILTGVMDSLDIGAPEQRQRILQTLDQLEKVGRERVQSRLETLGMKARSAEELLELLTTVPSDQQSTEPILSALADRYGPSTQTGVEELSQVLEQVAELGVPTQVMKMDLAIARGLDYYTGTVYETTLVEHRQLGSICSGGRYDNLASYFTNTKLPGVGISIGFTRLFGQLLHHVSRTTPPVVQVLVANLDDPGGSFARQLGNVLRQADICTETRLVPGRLKHQLRYAQRAGIPLVVFAGETERESGEVAVKNLTTGTQVAVPHVRLVEQIKLELAAAKLTVADPKTSPTNPIPLKGN